MCIRDRYQRRVRGFHRGAMRTFAPVVLAAIAIVSVALDSSEAIGPANVESATELLQHSSQHTVRAKQGIRLGEANEATVKIMGREVSAVAIRVAQKKVRALVEKLGVRWPEMISSISTIQEMTDRPGQLGEEGIEGGFKKMIKVLHKIDEMEQQLVDEHVQLKTQIETAKAACAVGWKQSEERLNGLIAEYEHLKAAVVQHKNGILADKNSIKKSEENEVEVWADRLEISEVDTKAAYDKYWLESDDRAEVRNVLMQAVWLVCYGFRQFRHDHFCIKLRKQPDFGEHGIAQPSTADPGHAANAKTSYSFSETMEQVWQQQRAADAHAVNEGDGDPDMEKGFVNNKAPWGVDPDDAERESGTRLSLVQEAVGADDSELLADGSMSTQAIASRLQFLLESSSISERGAAPIQELAESFRQDLKAEAVSDSDGAQILGEAAEQEPLWQQQNQRYAADLTKKRTLVKIMADIEKEQGSLQNDADVEWRQWVRDSANALMADAQGLSQESSVQNDYQNSIKNHNIQINEISKVDIAKKKAIDDLTTSMHNEMEICEVKWMELDVNREANEQEQTNIRRLNSLLRVLSLGDTPTCTAPENGSACSSDSDRGECVFLTRGNSEGGSGSEADKDKTLCACEARFYGTDCEMSKCPGLGHTWYKDTDPGVCSNRGGRCDDAFCGDNGCDATVGKCTSCSPKFHGHGAKYNKCQFRYCPMPSSSAAAGFINGDDSDMQLPSSQDQLEQECSKHGQCDRRSGKCSCDAEFWGAHCGWKKCPGAATEGAHAVATKFAGWSTSACHNRGECATRLDSDGQLEGFCKCDESQHSGESCEFHVCPGNCQDRGTCKRETGMCMCNAPHHGATCQGGEGGKRECFACTYTTCPDDCGGIGACNKISGHCVCSGQSNGAKCKVPSHSSTYVADWTRSLDKWGWSVCKDGHLLIGLKRDGAGNALYNLAYGKCARPSEGEGEGQVGIRTSHCYHENWWKKFDYMGGKMCRKNYFVAGLFRSHCNSLYCLEMAKCCQVLRALWNECKWVEIKAAFSDRNCRPANGIVECSWAEIQDGKSFIAGFYREKEHTLDGLTYIRKCEPYFFGDKCRPGQSGPECD
eukprot:TRINITY_DN13_c0_g1_i2.p1 TRINITY_DN13_c0_g1~~TRINITY_DN13_c0_g1_i2.p1  ORF type:complete len:1101 (-),score=278.30 TRINITY_DN13_c0_g1_i2:124-3426(-)